MLRWVLVLPVVVALWFAAGAIGALISTDGEAPGDDVVVRLVGSAIHYDFALPATRATRAAFGFAADAGVPVDAPEAAWIFVGWGARDFYTSTAAYSDMAPGPIWSAVTGDRSVLRIDVWGEVAMDIRPSISLSDRQYARLLAAIAASTNGTPLDHPGFTATDRFFTGVGSFHVLRTCNVWVGEMLRAAGLRFGIWTPTPQAVRLAVSRLR